MRRAMSRLPRRPSRSTGTPSNTRLGYIAACALALLASTASADGGTGSGDGGTGNEDAGFENEDAGTGGGDGGTGGRDGGPMGPDGGSVGAEAPSIIYDANLWALVNQPYIYNEARAVTVRGAPPFSFRSCDDSTGLQVDAMSGAVRWTPTAVGQYSLCVQANNPFGEDRYAFTVEVGLGEPEAVTAAFSATPNVGQPTPTLAVKLDASASVDSLGQPPLAFLWSYGDGSSPGAGMITSHDYVLPGGYVARLSAFSKSGARGDATGTIELTDASGTRPPRALIRASHVRGDGSLTVDFSCLCEGPSPIAEYRWDLGNGSTATTPTASATYSPGRYHAMLMVVDSAGLPAWDKIEIVVTRDGAEPPECTAAVDPPAGVVPLGAVWTAWAAASSDAITRTTWTLGETDTSTEAVIPRSYTTPGWYTGKLVVEDSQGLTCSDRVVATAIAQPGTLPPRIISQPALAASCGTAYEYSTTKKAVALGTGPLRWSAPQAPDGFVIDPSTGAISWTPQPPQGEVSLVLRVEGAAGSDEQLFSVKVSCPGGLDFATTCGCGSSGGGLAFTALGVLAAAFMRRSRRSRARLQRSPT